MKDIVRNKTFMSIMHGGILYVILGASLWGSMGIWVRNIREAGMNSMDITFLRCFGITILLGIYGIIFNRSMLKIRRKDLWCFLGTGIISILFFNYCYMTTITRTSLSVAAVLLYTSPSFVILFSRLLFHEKITKRKLVSLLMALAGCVCVSGICSSHMIIGGIDLLIGIGAGLGYALYSIFGRYALLRGYSSLTITFYTFLVASIGVLPFVNAPKLIHTVILTKSLWPYVAGLVVIVTLFAYLLYTFGLSRMETGKAAIASCIEPVVAALLGWIVYREKLGFMEILGIFLVVGSTVAVNFVRDK